MRKDRAGRNADPVHLRPFRRIPAWRSGFGCLFRKKQKPGSPCRRQQNPFSRQISQERSVTQWCTRHYRKRFLSCARKFSKNQRFKNDPARSDKYVAVLKAISEIDARGQWLVVSALPRTARANTGGIKLVERSLKQLDNGHSITGPNFPVADWAYRLPKRVLGQLGLHSSAEERFPVVESVYHVLTDADYRLWLDQQQEALRQAHLDALYDHLVSAFQADDVRFQEQRFSMSFFFGTALPSTGASTP